VLLAFLLGTAVCMWKIFIMFTMSEIPIVVVLSGSMEPGYERGDLLLLSKPNRPLEVGDIVVFKIKDREIPIVHRVHRMHITANGTKKILTKGDNNYQHDEGLYKPGQFFIDESDIMGTSFFYLPYVGQLTIKLSEVPWARESMIVVLLVFIFIFNEVE
jgi:signal peptidase